MFEYTTPQKQLYKLTHPKYTNVNIINATYQVRFFRQTLSNNTTNFVVSFDKEVNVLMHLSIQVFTNLRRILIKKPVQSVLLIRITRHTHTASKRGERQVKYELKIRRMRILAVTIR